MRTLVTGSSGLIGRALVALLDTKGHSVTPLLRLRSKSAGASTGIHWDPIAGIIDRDALEGFDAVVHLAGESIVGRWTAAKKARILESRVQGTRLLCESLAKLRTPPKVLVSASAVGYYGDRLDELLDEESSPGLQFLSEVAKAWEDATEPAARSGIRVVNSRIGFVLSKDGGGLAAMLTPFKLGIAGRLGNGRQYLSWIALDDVVEAMLHAMLSEPLRGPVNFVAPLPVTNLEFTKILGRILGRPTVFPVPAIAVRALMGEMGNELLLSSTRVQPTRLLASGYQFRFPDLIGALRNELGQ